ncbi:S24 family peptidase [Methyloligella solikamskensis]|uniref:Helix-turn-helix transcriptional regulator n=1 Tax=Methyloligella solikamskensis TaxID=1177756 RepID=A0ABW3JFA4_9HYPH
MSKLDQTKTQISRGALHDRLTHANVWSAIDALAQRYNLSTSALAKSAGLDATSFNRSKRTTAEGRPRWPTTESISKVLQATGAGLDEFVQLLCDDDPAARPVPLIGLTQAGAGGFFDDGGFPAGSGWDAVTPPGLADENAYALEVAGDSMAPLYRPGDVLIVSPAASIRKGDRLVAKTTDGEVMAKILVKRGQKAIELASLNPEHSDLVFPLKRIEWMHRILWVSQ